MPLAQARVEVVVGPVTPSSIEIRQETAFGITSVTRNGFAFRGPRATSRRVPLSMLDAPPPPVLKATPCRCATAGSITRPAWATACLAEATAKWVERAILRAALPASHSVGSKSCTSQAILTLNASVSNAVIGPAPESPAFIRRQKVGTSLPTGVTAPSPVITIRPLSVAGIARG